ncbi:MAG TPA: response regulator [Candidatus Kapabacteria bacterium]|nr:response regulator [Candidatus Kapabacteria bacterium]
MKTILFLDDDERRTSEIRSRLIGEALTLITVATALECIERLSERAYDLVMLDHDLGGEIFVDSSREDTGMEVVRWLRENGGAHGAFIVHTMNPVAAAGMYFDLTAQGYTVQQTPFGSPEFFAAVYEILGMKSAQAPRPTLKERLRNYGRGLRRR